jgi:hypothetical protein
MLSAALAFAQSAWSQVSQASAADFVRIAKARMSAMNPDNAFVRQISMGPNTGKWIKIQELLIAGDADVRRTDSVVEPAVATVEFSARTRASTYANSEDEAKSLPILVNDLDDKPLKVEAIFLPTPSGWQLKSGRYKASDLPNWLPIKPEDLSSPSAERRFPHKVLLAIQKAAPPPKPL